MFFDLIWMITLKSESLLRVLGRFSEREKLLSLWTSFTAPCVFFQPVIHVIEVVNILQRIS